MTEDDYKLLREFYAPDVACEFIGDKSRIPYAGRRIGIEALISIVRSINIDFEQSNHVVNDIIVDGGRVAVRRSVDWRHRGTGRRGRVDLAEFARFENGRHRRDDRVSRHDRHSRHTGRSGVAVSLATTDARRER